MWQKIAKNSGLYKKIGRHFPEKVWEIQQNARETVELDADATLFRAVQQKSSEKQFIYGKIAGCDFAGD